jgi:DNA-binding protein YbaB
VTDDMIKELMQFQQYTTKLQQLMSDMHNQMPRHADGVDSQGAVTVRLGADGLPETIKVSSDWQRRQSPEAIGAAVVEAFGSAMSDRMERWSRAVQQSDWEARAGQLDRAIPATFTGGPASAGQPSIPERDLRYVLPRPLDEVTEELLTALDSVDSMDAEGSARAEATGASSGRKVAITVTKGAVVDCAIDPQWASAQSSVRLNQALDEALSSARTKLAEAEAAVADGPASRQMDGLFDEALAILQNPQRYAD